MKHALIGMIWLGLIPSAVMACLWDYDTIFMERQRFPTTLEVITGKFLRHTSAFYEWRIADRAKRLETTPNDLSLYDDMAVAYDKLGQHQLAIETILKKEAIEPGMYETLANLGTFHIHAGNLERGVELLEQAIRVKPDAHFGREKYQVLLVKYVLQRRRDGQLRLPLAIFEEGLRESDFADFLIETENRKAESSDDPNAGDSSEFNHRELTPIERAAAIKGILGMMHFGKFDSPVLLEVLGDVLCNGDWSRDDNARLLGIRAYLKASMHAPNDEAKAAYRDIADKSRGHQSQVPGSMSIIALGAIEKDLHAELREANEWFNGVEKNEAEWIAKGLNADEEFAKSYRTEPELTPSIDLKNRVPAVLISVATIVLCVFLVTSMVIGKILRDRWRKRGSNASSVTLPVNQQEDA